MLNKISLFIFSMILPTLAWSQSYQLGEAIFGGNGCRPGTASIAVSPDASSISVLFDDFNVDPSGAAGRDRRVKTDCTVIIPVSVTPGYTVETATIDYRGFTSVDKNSLAAITTYHSRHAAMNGVRFGVSKVIYGPFEDVVYAKHVVKQNAGIKRCPAQHQIYLGISATVQSASKPKGGHFTLDSADVGGDAVTLGVALMPCRQ